VGVGEGQKIGLEEGVSTAPRWRIVRARREWMISWLWKEPCFMRQYVANLEALTQSVRDLCGREYGVLELEKRTS